LIKLPRKVIVLVAVVLVALVALTLYLQYNSAQSTGPWTSTTPYPLASSGTGGVLGESCVTTSSTVYCIGGEDVSNSPHDSVYYAALSSSGIGNWSLDRYPYPQPIMFASCVTYTGYVYCIGGTHTSAGNDTSSSYFAPIQSQGLGNWTATSPFPIAADSQSCVTATGRIFCIGGENETAGSGASATDSVSVWSASLSGSGVGIWSRTTAYPGVFFPTCTALGGYVYCVGGQTSSGTPVSSSYYAPVSPEGLGQWVAGSPYPVATIAQSCTVASTTLYCVGGLVSGGSSSSAVYYAGLSPSGVGNWQQGGSYPMGLSTECVASSSYVYCIGGYDPSSGPTPDTFFAPAVSTTTSSSSG
jgi:hypothetical protein